MKLSEKMHLFLAKALLADCSVGKEELGVAEVSGLALTAEHLLLERGVSLQSAAMARKGGESFIGAYSYMNSGGYLRESVFIGRYCSIGRRVSIGAGAHVMTGVSTSPFLRGSHSRCYSESECTQLWPDRGSGRQVSWATVLGSDVWVGDGAVIVPGINIGIGAVVGANSVVTRDVPPYAIVAGSPARVVRLRFSQEIVQQLLASEYWEFPLPVLAGLPMRHVLDFLDALPRTHAMSENYSTMQLRS